MDTIHCAFISLFRTLYSKNVCFCFHRTKKYNNFYEIQIMGNNYSNSVEDEKSNIIGHCRLIQSRSLSSISENLLRPETKIDGQWSDRNRYRQNSSDYDGHPDFLKWDMRNIVYLAICWALTLTTSTLLTTIGRMEDELLHKLDIPRSLITYVYFYTFHTFHSAERL